MNHPSARSDQREEFILKTSDQTDLFVTLDHSAIPEIKATVVIVHGVCEHSGRYDRLTSYLTGNGYRVIRFDLRGHGKSGGIKGYVQHFRQFGEDTDMVVSWAAGLDGNRPTYMLGHSMGAFISAVYAINFPGKLHGQILSGLPATILPLRDIRLLRCLPYNLFPMLAAKNSLADKVSKDPEVVKQYKDDPLNLKKSTIKMSGEMFLIGPKYLAEHLAEYSLPCLILHGEADQIVAAESSEWFFRHISSTDKKRILYPGLHHEIYNEPEYKSVINDTLEWLHAHAADVSLP